MMLDGPCSFHTKHPSRPSNHTMRNCSWYQRKPESAGPTSRPTPLTGVNTVPLRVRTPPRPADDRVRPEDVNQVANVANTNNPNNNDINNPNSNNNNAGPS